MNYCFDYLVQLGVPGGAFGTFWTSWRLFLGVPSGPLGGALASSGTLGLLGVL